MKVFKKVFAFAIALTAIAMASSAMANGTATYTSDHKVQVAAIERTEGQTTVAVVNENFGETDASVEDIYYIDQDEAAVIASKLATGVGLKDKDSSFVASSLQVRVGGGNAIEYFDVPEYAYEIPEPTEDVIVDGQRRLGVDGTVNVNGSSSVAALKFLLNDGTADAEYIWNFDSAVNAIQGKVTFGLEINNVPESVAKITIKSVQASATAFAVEEN